MFKRYILILIVVFAAVKAFAQTGLGDPVIYRNFESGSSTYGAAIPGYIGGTAPYTYSNSGVPPEGSYTILNNTNIAPSLWWPITDHTSADGQGYMLIVKTRSSGFQVLFEQGVDNLCAGTNYEFGAFIANIARNPGVTPRVRLRVETNTTPRSILQEVSVPINYNAAGVIWANPIVRFSPAANGSIIVSIISETPGGPSTDDLAIDDITVNAEGQKIDAAFDAGAGAYREVCVDSPTSFSATATTPVNGNYMKWQRKIDGGTWVDITTASATGTNVTFNTETVPGFYRYRAASASSDKIGKFSCSVVTNELTIWVKPVVTANAGSPKFFLRGGNPVMLQGSSNSGNYFWTVESGSDISSLNSSTVLNPVASPNETTVYVLHATGDANTCGPDVISKVKVSVADDINLPNTFTPNGDGINDKWVIGGITSYQNPIVQVYNRNGQLVFRSLGGGTPWDGTYKGKNVPVGNYYYMVDLNVNGMKFTGSLTLIR